jgi:predicted amidohydrolase YtcJ
MPVLDSLQPLSGHGPEENGLGLSHGMSSGFGSDLLSLGPAKVFLDGSLLAETAAMTEPYCSHGHGDLGYLQADPTVLQASMHAAYRSGWALAVHAIGDRAIDLAINILRELRDVHGPRTLPDRIEHGALIRPDQLPQLAALEVGVTPQSSFFWVSGDQMAASLGPRRSPWAYRAASLLDAGIPVAGSSDRPVADGSVLRGMQAYVDRLTSSGAVFGARKERLTRRQALSLYTTGAAAVTGMSMTKGSLSPGKLADAVVLSGSPLIAEQIADLTIEATVFGGVLRPLPTSTF